MAAPPDPGHGPDAASLSEAVARWHQEWITGLILGLVQHAGIELAETFVFRLFRLQQTRSFLPGLTKLGLDGEPAAVAAAKYHYFSNQIGGVRVEYLLESDRKAWVRYPPPRWIWDGAAVCAVPTRVNAAMMHGWHANNGVLLGNLRLGFVCTGMTTEGDPGLEGYYREFDHDLPPNERLRFAPHEVCPPIDPTTLPVLDAASWPAERLARANRRYAMTYVANALPLLGPLLGLERAARIGGLSARQVAMQNFPRLAAAATPVSPGPDDPLALVANLLAECGGEVSRQGASLVVRRLQVLDLALADQAAIAIWSAALDGLVRMHDRQCTLRTEREGPGLRLTLDAR